MRLEIYPVMWTSMSRLCFQNAFRKELDQAVTHCFSTPSPCPSVVGKQWTASKSIWLLDLLPLHCLCPGLTLGDNHQFSHSLSNLLKRKDVLARMTGSLASGWVGCATALLSGWRWLACGETVMGGGKPALCCSLMQACIWHQGPSDVIEAHLGS